MIKTVFIFLWSVGVLCAYPVLGIFAQSQETSTSEGYVKYFVGVVVSRSGSGTRAEISVVNSKGQKMSFSVKKSTSIAALRFNNGKDGVTAADIKKGSKVSVQYTTDPQAIERVQAVVITE